MKIKRQRYRFFSLGSLSIFIGVVEDVGFKEGLQDDGVCFRSFVGGLKSGGQIKNQESRGKNQGGENQSEKKKLPK